MKNCIPIHWSDLLKLSKAEVLIELTISLPWLATSCWLAAHNNYIPALLCSFMFFLTGLRQTHNAFHNALGLSRAATHWVMFTLSVAMLGSMHAVQVNHLRHHLHCMEDEDIEAMSARLPWWKALLVGPLFPFRLHQKAIAVGTPSQRVWIFAEIGANFVWIALALLVFNLKWLEYHIYAMAVGHCFTAFFAVWTVHHGCTPGVAVARTVRGRFKSLLTYNMFFHVEHHMFPAVPTCKLPVLAKRLDLVAPELAQRRAF